MARLQHLLQPEPIETPDTYNINLGDDMIQVLSVMAAQHMVSCLAPTLKGILEQGEKNGEAADVASEAASKALTASTKALESAISSMGTDVKGELKKAVKALSTASSGDVANLRDALVKALGAVKIPDNAERLDEIQATQRALMIEVSQREEPATEWDFTVNRNNQGFITSVTAKAK